MVTEIDPIIIFTHKEIVTALLKEKGIHKGIWMLYVEFGLSAANFPVKESDDQPEPANPLDIIMPVAVIPIKKIGIRPGIELSALAVDAAVVNPDSKSTVARKPPEKK